MEVKEKHQDVSIIFMHGFQTVLQRPIITRQEVKQSHITITHGGTGVIIPMWL